MSRVIKLQTNFTVGEINPELRGRIDLQQYESALERARNVIVNPRGTVDRRPGLKYQFTLPSAASPANGFRLVPFTFSTTQTYMLLFLTGRMYVFYSGGTQATDINGITGRDYLDIDAQETFTISGASGTFTQGETITGGTSGETAEVLADNSGTLLVRSVSGAFTATETITGGTSTETATFDSTATTVTDGVAAAQLTDMWWVQSADTLLLFQEDMKPIQIQRGASNSTWTVTDIAWENIPRYLFTASESNPAATLTPSATDGNITLTASASVFTTNHVGQKVYDNNSGIGLARIVSYTSGTVVEAITETPFFNTSAIASGNWTLQEGWEDAWSETRDWPRTATFHEGRLIIGGSKSLPTTVWGSKVGFFFDFDLGQALDDEGLEATIDTDQVNAVTAVMSGRDLQTFTTGTEFTVPQLDGEPLTPSSFLFKVSTRRGSEAGIRPQMTEGGTIYLQRGGKSLREHIFNDVEGAFVSNDISLLSSHLLQSPSEIVMRRGSNVDEGDLLLVVNGGSGTLAGSIGAFSILRSQNVIAPSLLTTEGTFENVGIEDSDTPVIYAVCKRTINSATVYYLETFDLNYTTDAAQQTTPPAYGTTLVNGAAQSGTTLIVDGFTVQPQTGDKFTIDSVTGTYTISSATALSGDESTLTLEETLDSSPADNAAVTFTTVRQLDNLSHLEAATVKVIADDAELGDETVSSGSITIDRAADTYVEVGLDYPTFTDDLADDATKTTPLVRTMPVETRLSSGPVTGFLKRIIEVDAILDDTQNLSINGDVVPFRRLDNDKLDSGIAFFTGTKVAGPFLGYDKEGQIEVTQTAPLFFTLLALDYKVSVGQ